MLRLGPSRWLHGIELIPIEATQIHGERAGAGVMVFATKAPTAIVVRSRHGIRAFDLEGGALPLGPLVRDVPGLAERMTSTDWG